MKKSISLIVLAVSFLVAAPAYAISISISLADESGAVIKNANCIAVDEQKKGHLFDTDAWGKATLDKVNGENLHVHCDKDGNQLAAKVKVADAKAKKTTKLAKTGLFSVSVSF